MKKWVFIMRGAPGCGKSSISEALVAANGGVIHTTDSFFMEDGEYKFDPSKLSEAHEWNLNSFIESLKKGIEVVICDNTNILASHYSVYEDAARNRGYSVRIITVTGGSAKEYERNCGHGVPIKTIERMRMDLSSVVER